MFLNSWRLRLGLIGAGIILAVAWTMCGASLLPGSEARILIEVGASGPDARPELALRR